MVGGMCVSPQTGVNGFKTLCDFVMFPSMGREPY